MWPKEPRMQGLGNMKELTCCKPVLGRETKMPAHEKRNKNETSWGDKEEFYTPCPVFPDKINKAVVLA